MLTGPDPGAADVAAAADSPCVPIVAVPGLGLSAEVSRRFLALLDRPSEVIELPGYGLPAGRAAPGPADLARLLLDRLPVARRPHRALRELPDRGPGRGALAGPGGRAGADRPHHRPAGADLAAVARAVAGHRG